MFKELIAAVVFFIVIPIIFSRLLGWRGKNAQFGLIIIAALYWIYSWYVY